VDIFRDLTPDAMHEIETTTVMVTCEPGRVFYRADDPAEVLFILKRVRSLSHGRPRMASGSLQRRYVMGRSSGRCRSSASGCSTQAEARSACLICVMSRRDVNDLLTRYPSIALRIVEVLSRRLDAAETRLEEMAFRGLRERLATLLLQLVTEQDWRGPRSSPA
jgi:CRP/FNR family transcriptional regulator